MSFDLPHPEFRFRSPRVWTQIPSEDNSRLQLFCAETQTTLMMTIEMFSAPPEKFEAIARFIADARKKAHIDAIRPFEGPAAESALSYHSEKIEMHATGLGYEISYEGTHRNNSFFGFLGFVTSRKLVNVFIETKMSFVPGRSDMYNEVVRGFQVVMP